MNEPELSPGTTGVVIVDLAQLAANWQALAALVAPAECGAVVKANAYGLGAGKVIPALWRAGCRTFFIATIDEAREARAGAPEARLYVLDGLLPESAKALLELKSEPVLSSVSEVKQWAARGAVRNAALHIDTGLNRLGLDAGDLDALTSDFACLRFSLVMSHLACADEPDDPMNERQRAAFAVVRKRFPKVRASLAASDGLMLGKDYHFDLVRPGYALYGGQASRGRTAPVKPVVTVRARVLQVRDVARGSTVGYSATYVLHGTRRIATIAAGYADGIPRTASATNSTPGGAVAYKGRRAPIIGRVSMDLVTADITDIPDLAPGDWVDLIGPDLALEEAGARAGTIGYEILTRLPARFHRVYLNEMLL